MKLLDITWHAEGSVAKALLRRLVHFNVKWSSSPHAVGWVVHAQSKMVGT